MSSVPYIPVRQTPVNGSGRPYAGATATFYRAGTTTLQSVYADSARTTQLTNPVVADATGVFPAIYMAPDYNYRVILKTSTGVTLRDDDNVPSTTLTASGVGSALYPRTAGEVAASVMPTAYQYAPGDIRRYGAVEGADSTQAVANALASSLTVYIPAGTWRVDTINVTRDGTRIRTDGFASIVQQNSGVPVATVVVRISASNVHLESIKVMGNISTDTSEFNHAVFVYKTGGSISNITVEDVYAENIRGDGLYIGAPAGYTTTQVKFGRITGKNVLRNVVSIVGGSFVRGDAAVSDTSTGYLALDIEADTVAGHNIYVGYVRGAAMGCVPPTAATTAYNIHVGVADLNPSYAADSTPAYASRNVSTAVLLRNTKDFRIDKLRVRNHTKFAVEYVYNSGETRGSGLSFGNIDYSGVGASESTYNTTMQFIGVDDFSIDSGHVALQAVGDSVVLGDSSGTTFTRGVIRKLTADGTVARYINEGLFSNILINTTNATSAFVNIYDSTVMDSRITIPTLATSCARNTWINVTATCTTAYWSSATDNMRINSEFGGNHVPIGIGRLAEAGQTSELVIGNTTQTTVGSAGGASALPATPTGYIKCFIGSTQFVIPYYAQA